MDMRILIEGEEYGRKLPGGFFRLPGDYEASETTDNTGRKFVTYAGWNSTFSNGIPLPMQRAIIEPYCVKNKISYNDYQFENEHMDWEPGLEHFIKQKPDGIVLCSIFSLPDDPERRTNLLELALTLKVELHFANELVSLKSTKDLEKIKTYLNFAVPKKGLQVWE
jgi:sporadic carbohydrate cluster protein (TIGR04323 family)